MARWRPFSPLVPLLIAALLLAACNGPAGRDAITLFATYDDVGALLVNHHVRAGDVPVGTITDIELTDDFRARVTMQVRPDTGLPEQVEAVLGRTALLGEMFIDLRPLADGGELSDGSEIAEVRTIQEFEQLVATGDRLLEFVAAGQLASAVQTGAVAFGGRGDLLGQFIEDVEGFLARYNADRDELVRLIDTLDAFGAALAPDADINAEGLAVLERASQVLEEEDDRLIDALVDLDDLVTVGARIMRDHRSEIANSIRRLRIVLEQLVRVDGALADLILWTPRHNIHVPNGVLFEQLSGWHFAQVWLDFVVCGINDEPGDPANACDPPNPGERAPDPGPRMRSDECYDDLEVCRAETDRDLGRSP